MLGLLTESGVADREICGETERIKLKGMVGPRWVRFSTCWLPLVTTTEGLARTGAVTVFSFAVKPLLWT